MDDDKIFRKVAMERLSSPENLDQVMRVVPARGWIALVCLFAFAAAAVCWACFGEIARQVEGQGMLLQESVGTAGEVIAALSAGDGSRVQPGMDAVISLDSGETLTGKIVSISNADDQTLAADGVVILASSLPDWTVNAADRLVSIHLNDGETDKAMAILTKTSTRQAGNMTGWFCSVRVTIETLHPIQMVLPDGAEKSKQ